MYVRYIIGNYVNMSFLSFSLSVYSTDNFSQIVQESLFAQMRHIKIVGYLYHSWYI